MSRPRILFFVLLFISVAQVGVDLYLPSLPHIQVDLATSTSTLKLTVTLYFVGLAVAPLIAGPLADRFGRRPLCLAGLPIGLIGSIGCAVSPNVASLLAFRLICGIGLGITSALSRTLLRDAFEGTALAKASSYTSIAWALSPTLAPVVGGYVEEWLGWHWNFYLLSFLIALSWIFVWLWLPETRPEAAPSHKWAALLRGYATVICSRSLVRYGLVIAFYYGLPVGFNVFGPYLLEVGLKLTPSQFGWSALLVAAAYVAGLILNSRIVRRFSLNTLILTGISMQLLAAVILLILSLNFLNWPSIVVPIAFSYLFGALIYPNCVAGFFAPFAALAGTAGAVFACLQYTAASLWGAADAFLGHKSAVPLGTTLTIAAGMALAAFLSVTTRQQKPVKQSAADDH